MCRFAFLALLSFASFTSCAKTQVAMQTIPISSIPTGADVYVDGTYVGKTPTCATLQKNSHHQVTLIKEGFTPQCLTINRIRNEEKLYRKALFRGVNTGLFTKDPAIGATSAIEQIEDEDETGEASELQPHVITLELVEEKIKP